MRLKSLMIAAAAVAAFGVAGADVAFAQSASDVIGQRQEKFKSFGAAMKAISDSLRSGSPDAAMIRTRAQYLAAQGPNIPGWFPKGSGPEAGVKTEALPVIWAQPADFRARAAAFTSAAQALEAAASSGNPGAIGKATQELGATCKGCHDNFRLKK